MFHDSDKTRRDLAASFHGRLAEVLPRLREAQRQGCGVYVAINRTDGRGRRKANIAEARVLFLDLDGTPLPESWPVEPDLIAHTSSPGDGVQKYQAYWLIDPTDEFGPWEACQKTLAEQFGGDPKCATRTQVARVAGFWHLKDPEHPHQVAIVHDSDPDLDLTWSLRLQATKLGLDLDAIRVRAEAARQTRNEPPPYGYDNPADVAAARRLVAEESNWHPTSDGGVSLFKMACQLRDLGISPELAVELIEEHLPRRPASWADDHVERKVANAFRYARGEPGERSREAVLHDFDDEPVDPEWAASLSATEERPEAEGAQAEQASRYRLWEVEELANLPPLQWLAEGMVVEQGLHQVYGPTKSHKTFIVLDLVLSIATGRPYHGTPTQRARVVYVIAEGQSDFYDRVAAWCIENKVPLEELRGWLRVVITPVPVDDFGEKGALTEFAKAAEAVAPHDLIVFDTVNRNMAGDENDTAAMSRFVKGCDLVRGRFGCAVLGVHHTGWDESRARGSSVLLAAVDVSLRVSRTDKNSLRTRLLIEHIRSGPAGRELFFDPAIVVTSCEPLRDSLVMRPTEAPERKPSRKQRKREERLDARDRLLQEIYERQPRHQKELVRDEPYRSQTMVSKLVREMQEDGLLEEDSLRVTPTKGVDLIEAIREADRAFGGAGGEAERGRDEQS